MLSGRNSMMTRECKKCRITQDIELFPKTGGKYRRYICRKCFKEDRIKHKSKKRKWFKQLKESLSCINCGYSKKTHKDFCSAALEFHHINPEDKSFVLGDSFMNSKERIIVEMMKCRVLCCRCHREEHY